MNFGEKIVSLRKSNGMTQAELGENLNVTYQAVSKWERGESSPDFATLSKIAKLFGVPITYFEDGEEEAAAVEATEQAVEPAADNAPAMLGFCKVCGRVLHEGEEHQTKPFILCEECHNRNEQTRKAEAKRVEDQRKWQEESEKRSVRRKRNIGLIVAAAVFAALAVVGGVCFGIGTFEPYTFNIVAWAIMTVFAFTFVSQMFWGGLVSEICTFGFIKVNFPGIIFSLDIDGIFFFIFVKLLFGFLSVFLWLAFGLITSIVAICASPVIFIPKVIRMSMGKDDSD
ncbi:MAG: helix-turn-helix domain-containing protein [Clostridia bacterium]|nr:helix-turn-helix domain-containing protein [Clostridia bacterium]